MRILTLPQDYAVSLRFKFPAPPAGSKSKAPYVFFECGHHAVRLYTGKDGTRLVLGHVLTKDKENVYGQSDAKLETGRWYRLFVENQGDEVVFQIGDKLRFRASHESIKQKRSGFQINAWRPGIVIDDLHIWAVTPKKLAAWPETRKTIPTRKTD